jgi:hypothetical protein
MMQIPVPDDLVDALRKEEEITAAMVTYRKKTTGVDNSIFISTKVPGHQPRIKVAIDPPTHISHFGKTASVAIADGRIVAGSLDADVQRQVKAFLNLNREVLLDYWEERIDTDELRERLRKV